MPRLIPEATDQQISRYSAKIGSNGGEMALDPPMQDNTAAQWEAYFYGCKRSLANPFGTTELPS